MCVYVCVCVCVCVEQSHLFFFHLPSSSTSFFFYNDQWDILGEGHLLADVPHAHQSTVNIILPLSGGLQFATCSNDSTIRIWFEGALCVFLPLSLSLSLSLSMHSVISFRLSLFCAGPLYRIFLQEL